MQFTPILVYFDSEFIGLGTDFSIQLFVCSKSRLKGRKSGI